MRKLALALLVLGATALAAQDRPTFETLDLVVESGDRPLGAYQVELTGGAVVGLEGGESKAWAEAPYYDPAALEGGRLIVAAFTLDASAPAGKIRVARIHVMGNKDAKYEVKLMAAAAAGGDRTHPKVELVRHGGDK